MLRAVIFDMDGTLIDWSQRPGDWTTIIQGHLKPIYDHLIAAGHTLPTLDWVTLTYQECSSRAWGDVQAPTWDCPRQIDILRETLIVLNLDVEHLDVPRLQRLYGWGAVPGVSPYQDAESVLKAVRTAGVRTGLITNTAMPMWMRDVELAAFGLLEHLEVRLTAGDVGKLKPHPQPFRVAMDQLGVVPDEAVYIGDHLRDDILGAQGAGLRAVWFRGDQHSNGSVKPNATVDSLSELLGVLDLWFPGWR